jgi:hypothetical protein
VPKGQKLNIQKLRDDYVNRCGFHIVEFYNDHNPDPYEPEEYNIDMDQQFPDGMFRFEKIINKEVDDGKRYS